MPYVPLWHIISQSRWVATLFSILLLILLLEKTFNEKCQGYSILRLQSLIWHDRSSNFWNQKYSTVWVTSNHDNNNDDEIITMQIRMLMSAHTYRICSVPVLIAAHMWTHRSIRITLWGCYYKPHFTKKEMTQRAENSHTIPIPLSHSDSRG